MRLPIDSVESRMIRDWHRFGFFQAVRLLIRMARQVGKPASSDAPDEAVRFATAPSLGFPPNELAAIELPAGNDAMARAPVAKLTVNFMGLTGPQGVLPRAYTWLLMDCERQRDHATRDFFDLFNHRLISLFWRSWAKYRPWVGFEASKRDEFAVKLLSLVGMGTPSLERRLDATEGGLPQHALAYYCGILGNRPIAANSIERVLADFLGLPARIEPFRGGWLRLTNTGGNRLGNRDVSLGSGLVLGSRVWDRQSRLRLVIGPLNRIDFDALLPNGFLHRPLVELFRFMAGIMLDLEIQVIVRKDAVPVATLGDTRHASRLGWNTWIASGPLRRDADQCVYHYSAMRSR